jgi:hypothetical protein
MMPSPPSAGQKFSNISGTQSFFTVLTTTKHQSVHKPTEIYLKEKMLPPRQHEVKSTAALTKQVGLS